MATNLEGWATYLSWLGARRAPENFARAQRWHLRQLHKSYILMRKQCLMFMLLLDASERAEKNPLKIKFRKDIVESDY